MLSFEFVAICITPGNSQQKGREAESTFARGNPAGCLRLIEVETVGVESLLKAVAVKVGSHAERMFAMGLCEGAFVLPDIRYHCGAAAFTEAGNAAIAEVQGIEVALARSLNE